MKKILPYLVGATLPLYVLDQITKLLVLRNIDVWDAHPVIPGFFDLVHVRNTGAAFGSFKDSNLFFIALSCVAIVVLTVLFLRNSLNDSLSRLAGALLFSGVLGNLTDRLLHGAVIDFLSFDLHIPFANPWPSFNVADSCICIAAVLFVVASWKNDVKKP